MNLRRSTRLQRRDEGKGKDEIKKEKKKVLSLCIHKYHRQPIRIQRGNAGEDFVCLFIPCPNCNVINWTNLNNIQKNYAGLDLECNQCGHFAQIKTSCIRSDGSLPFSRCSYNSWDTIKIPTSKNTIRDTLKQYKGKVHYIGVIYNKDLSINTIAISDVLSCKDIHDTGNYIISRNTRWYSAKVLNKRV